MTPYDFITPQEAKNIIKAGDEISVIFLSHWDSVMRNHKKLKTLARRMRTKEELKNKVPIFQTVNWEKAKEVKSNKKNNIKKIK